MGSPFKFIANLVSKTPKPSQAPVQELKKAADADKKARQVLTATLGGEAGEKLIDENLKKRNTLLGN